MNKQLPEGTTFLLSPAPFHRLVRHLALLLAVLVVSINYVYMGFHGYHELLGHTIFFCIFFIFATYMALGYFNIYVLIPQLLRKEKYAAYFSTFFVSTLGVMLLHYGLEYGVFRYYGLLPGLYSYFGNTESPFWLEFVASFLTESIAILGVGFTVLFKDWLSNDIRIHDLENQQVHAEVEKLKEQVNPAFLLSTLQKIEKIAGINQTRASDMVVELSEVLRYELYDCNRQEVLLMPEINFLHNYLRLEQAGGEEMPFRIDTEGAVSSVLVTPLLFLPLVRYAVWKRREEGETFELHLRFRVASDSISFFCTCGKQASVHDPRLANIRARLDRLYPERYQLQITGNASPHLFLQINFRAS